MGETNVVALSVIKDRIKAKENVVGMTFRNERNALGTILEALSDHKKRQAEMTCTTEGCTETHIREQSDWHQSYACRTHGKSKSRSGTGNGVGGGIKSDDGQTFKFMPIVDSDDAETRKVKEANNSFYVALKAQREEEARIAKLARENERRAKVEEGRRERALKLEADKKSKLKDQLARIRAYAEKMNVPVSDVTLKMVERQGK